jgi:Ca2+:H+ antiporter
MILNILLLFIPLALVLDFLDAPPTAVFATAAVAIIPLAEWMRRATEHISNNVGSVIGGLLNVTFGNMAELILALFVLASGNAAVVKATITGSIIGNSLLGLGLAVVVGSWGKARQSFNRERAGLLASLMIMAVIAVLVPALFDYTERGVLRSPHASMLDEHMSLGVAVVLILVYICNLIYTLFTHRDFFASEEEEDSGHGGGGAAWSTGRSLLVLLAATAGVAAMAELVSGALEPTARGLGLSEFFLGIIVLPIVGNAAEYFSAIYFARKDRMGLVMNIAVGATIQVALLTAPVLVLVSFLMGRPMNLVFSNPLELIAVASAAFVVNSIAQDGETTWFEGVMLLAVYLLLAIAFYFVSP